MTTIKIRIDEKKLYYTTENYKLDEDFIYFTDNKGIEKVFSKKLVEEISRGEEYGRRASI